MNEWSLRFGEVVFYDDDESNFTEKEMVLSCTANEKAHFKIELDDKDGSRTIISCAYLDVQIKANSNGKVLINDTLFVMNGEQIRLLKSTEPYWKKSTTMRYQEEIKPSEECSIGLCHYYDVKEEELYECDLEISYNVKAECFIHIFVKLFDPDTRITCKKIAITDFSLHYSLLQENQGIFLYILNNHRIALNQTQSLMLELFNDHACFAAKKFLNR